MFKDIHFSIIEREYYDKLFCNNTKHPEYIEGPEVVNLFLKSSLSKVK
jgi:hypothetical protein